MIMQLSVEILDHIFSFLTSHPDILVACSTDPILSPIVERHLYCHLIVNIGDGSVESIEPQHGFELHHLSELLSAKPHISRYVRTLELKFEFDSKHPRPRHDGLVEQLLCEFTTTLVNFPSLTCIMLKATDGHRWLWPQPFQAALKGRLQLPSVKSVHFDDSSDLLLPLLDNCQNIVDLSLTGLSLNIKGFIIPSTFPQLKSLTFIAPLARSESPVMAWVKPHIKELESLRCALPTREISELLDICSGTLRTLDINLAWFCGRYTGRSGEAVNRLVDLSPTPPNLQQLVLRTSILLDEDQDHIPDWYLSTLPAASEVVNMLIPSRHLILDITISFSSVFSTLANVDFSPLEVLGALSVPRIDLYIHTNTLPSALTRAQLVSSLEDYGDVMRSIKEGILVIHAEKIAPY